MLHHFIENRTLSYIVGLLQSDGHHWAGTGNRGKVTLELQASDRQTLEQLKTLFPAYPSIRDRTRDTNFKIGAQSVTWTICDQGVRESLRELGVPIGKKSDLIGPPTFEYVASDYFRGLIDGDGSLGFTRNGFPFLSFVTKSTVLARAYEEFLRSLTGKTKVTNPNTRDRVYNICVYKEDAQTVADHLYKGSEISLERKYRAYLDVMKWLRPATMVKVTWSRKRWSQEDDDLLMSYSVEEAVKYLGRTEKAVRIRKIRLTQASKSG